MSANFLTQPIQAGLGGIVTAKARDLLKPTEKARLINLRHTSGGSETVRAGQQAIETLPDGQVHSLRRMNAQRGGVPYARVYGAGTRLYIGQAGNAQVVSGGFSGAPLSLTPHHSKNGGDTWMFVGDSAQTAKVNLNGLVLPIGLPKPGLAAGVTPAKQTHVVIEDFEGGFTPFTIAGGGGLAVLDYPASGKSDNALRLTTAVGIATTGYASAADKAINVDLTQIGPNPATDDDLIHLWIKIDQPDKVKEVRVYFTLGAFTAGTIPGTDLTLNTNAYMKAFRPNDDTAFVVSGAAAVPTAAEIAAIEVAQQALQDPNNDVVGGGTTGGDSPPHAQLVSLPTTSGYGQWTEFGVVDTPLRRGDFQRIGSDASVSWADVKGITIFVTTKAAVMASVWCDQCYLYGGYGIDSVDPGMQPYTWVHTNYDPRTGAESNYGAETVATEGLRTPINLLPAGFGDGGIRQRFYRKGGTTLDNWYFDGQNLADGGVFQSSNTDAVSFGTGLTAPIDNDQPVTTLDPDGNVVFHAAVSVIFGPVDGQLIAVGDVYRPGFMYWCNPGEPDHWSSDNSYEVCGQTEPLMTGGIYGSQAFVVSYERVYGVIPNLQTQGGLSAVPTTCAHGVVCKTGFAIGTGGMYLVSKDGIYNTRGTDVGLPISDDIRTIFDGTSENGLDPIDFAQPNQISLEIYDNDLWFGYQDVAGRQRCLIYSLLYRYWREYQFLYGVVRVCTEEGVPRSLLMGAVTTGSVYQHTGTTDVGRPIVWQTRSGTLNQGLPRADKQYGQVVVDIDTSAAVSITAFLDDETTHYGPVTVPATANGRERLYAPDVFASVAAPTAEVTSRNCALDLTGTIADGRLELWLTELAYTAEPSDYTSWGTTPIGHGLPGYKRLLTQELSLRSRAGVILTVEAFTHDGVRLGPQQAYTILSTGGQKTTVYVPFRKTKGVAFRYRYTSSLPFRIFPEDSYLRLIGWNQPQTARVQAFGTREAAQNSLMDGTKDPLLAALRPGGAA